jgi:hypothetical protein
VATRRKNFMSWLTFSAFHFAASIRSYTGRKSFSGSIRNGNEKRYSGIALHTAKHPLPLNEVAPIISAPTKLALNRRSPQSSPACTRALSLQNCAHSDTKAMLFIGTFGRYAAHNVICEERNLLECEVIRLKP